MTQERWCTFSLFKQLANVGADVGRAVSGKNKGRTKDSGLAFERALELLDATIADPKNHGLRRRELLRAREALIDHFMYDSKEYGTTDGFWDRYFYAFCYASAMERGVC